MHMAAARLDCGLGTRLGLTVKGPWLAPGGPILGLAA